MKLINNLVVLIITLIVGIRVQEETMDILYPNKPKGMLRNFIYNWKEAEKWKLKPFLI